MVEEFKPVVNFESLYEVSNLGNVRSLDRNVKYVDGRIRLHKGQLLKPSYRDEYPFVILWKDRKQKRIDVHILVLEAFIGPRPLGKEGCHNDGEPSNSALENLRWDTHSNNQLDQLKHGTHANANKITCPYNHLLLEPNILKKAGGGKQCLACNRANAYRSYRIKTGLPVKTLKEVADDKYKEIMSGSKKARISRV